MDEIFPIKGTESKEFTDPEILELIKRSNGEREKERIIKIIEDNEKGRSILFYEMLEGLGLCTVFRDCDHPKSHKPLFYLSASCYSIPY
ncbi:MAG: hypothetical protein ABIK99_06390 [candidate division WOR-3 bacterium]